jgi:hypothetical protein
VCEDSLVRAFRFSRRDHCAIGSDTRMPTIRSSDFCINLLVELDPELARYVSGLHLLVKPLLPGQRAWLLAPVVAHISLPSASTR